MKRLLLMSSIAILLASCSSLKPVSVQGGDLIVPESKIVTIPITATLDMQKTKIEHKVQWKEYNGTNEITAESIRIAKNDAYIETLIEYDCDAIVAPIFLTEVKGSKVIVTISGYPAKYKNFKQATEEDKWILDAYK